MPKLYLEEYKKQLCGKRIFVACREGILRDHFEDIVADLKFLEKQGIRPVLCHNMSNRFANHRHFKELAAKLPGSEIIRVPGDRDFYDNVLNHETGVEKILFLERKFLVDPQGNRINAISTTKAREKDLTFETLTANINFKRNLDQICRKIEQGKISRVHILSAAKQAIKNELFTIEGSGTLIANNFFETFSCVSSNDDVEIIDGILNIYKKQGYLKTRSREYIQARRDHFFIVRIDGIVVGCAEKIRLDAKTAELGALAISSRFRNQQIGLLLIRSFLDQMKADGFSRVVSLTNNQKLGRMYLDLGFRYESPLSLKSRQNQSPGVGMYLIDLES